MPGSKFEALTLVLYSGRLYFGRTPIVGNEHINFEKNRRKKIELNINKIEELKQKVKK